MAVSQQVKVRKALESTETLLTSLVDRTSLFPPASGGTDSTSNSNHTDFFHLGTDELVTTTTSDERMMKGSLIDVEQSLIGTGEAGVLNTPTYTATTTIDTLSSLGKTN